MNKLITIVLIIFGCLACASAQRVTNVTAEQQGQELLIHYHLEADGPVEVLLYLSTDRGSRWEGPLKSCSGDVGPNVAPGSGKRIRWEVLKDRELVGDGIAFKVVAKGGKLSSTEVAKRPWLNSKLTYGSVTDIDGNTYATIQIGTQVWMAENLRTTRYRNGDPIPNVTEAEMWGNLSSGAWCHYANDPSYEVPYGKLYNWHTVKDPRKLCPAGWHVPTDGEWEVLSDYLGGESVAGGKMKSAGTQHWVAPNFVGTNDSGFSGLPGGGRGSSGNFDVLGSLGYWWSASESGAESAWDRNLNFNNAVIYRYSYLKRNGFSLRCLRD
jgi:uncharacterized protein (TIGR02145 family)